MPTVRSNGIELAYESFGEGEPLVLIMGIGGQMVFWDEQFCRDLAARGFQVIRFDNRDVGLSTKLDQFRAVAPRESLKRKLLGRRVDAGYTLYDMADDTAGLIEALGFGSAHVVGMSLGGMVAQCLALKHPRHVRSLTLIMTNPGEVWANIPKPSAFNALLTRPGKTREEAIANQLVRFRMLGSTIHNTPEDRLAVIAGLHYDRGMYPRGFARQFAAMLDTPSRLRRLREIRVPTVVIHGAEDPLVPAFGGRLLAAGIPDARLMLIRGMGHDLAPSVWRYVIDAIVDNRRREPPRKADPLQPLRALLARPLSLPVP